MSLKGQVKLPVYHPRILPPRLRPGYIYFVRNTVTGNIRIGKAENVENKFRDLQSATDCDLELLHTVEVGDMAAQETALHRRFKPHQVRGEWYREEGTVRAFLYFAKQPDAPTV